MPLQFVSYIRQTPKAMLYPIPCSALYPLSTINAMFSMQIDCSTTLSVIFLCSIRSFLAALLDTLAAGVEGSLLP